MSLDIAAMPFDMLEDPIGIIETHPNDDDDMPVR